MRPTMADVAKRAGVSISTVSLVLNDKPGISHEVRTAVRQAVAELGYRARNRQTRAKAKPTRETKNITVVHYASPEATYRFEISGLFVDYAAALQDYFQTQNINWALIPDFREGDPSNLGFHLLNGKITADGFILIGIQTPDSPLLQNLLTEEKPIVVLSRYWPDIPVSTVSQDHRHHARIAMDHLVALGHRKIGFVARNVDQDFDWFPSRLDCYREVMAELGEPVDDSLICVGVNGAEAATKLLQQRPDITAVFAIHDENAVAAIQALQDAGHRVPQDVSVIGLDNSAKSPDGYPDITTVTFSHEKAAKFAGELLLRQMEDDSFLYCKTFVDSYLLQRESCAAPRE